MKMFLIKMPEKYYDYDISLGVLLFAENEENARELADASSKKKKNFINKHESLSSCLSLCKKEEFIVEEIPFDNYTEGILSSDFNAG